MYFPKELLKDSQDDGIIQGDDFENNLGHAVVQIEKE